MAVDKASIVLDTIQKWTIPVVMVLCGWVYQDVQDVREDLAKTKQEMVTRQELRDLENRIVDRLVYQLTAVNEKIAILLSQDDWKNRK